MLKINIKQINYYDSKLTTNDYQHASLKRRHVKTIKNFQRKKKNILKYFEKTVTCSYSFKLLKQNIHNIKYMFKYS